MKQKYWNQETDEACEIYFHNAKALSESEKEQLFTDKIYPKMVILASHVVNRSKLAGYLPMDFNELVNHCIIYSLDRLHTYQKEKGAAWSSYCEKTFRSALQIAMNHYSAKKRDVRKHAMIEDVLEDNPCFESQMVTDGNEILTKNDVALEAVAYWREHAKDHFTKNKLKVCNVIVDILEHPEKHQFEGCYAEYVADKTNVSNEWVYQVVKKMAEVNQKKLSNI